MCFFIFFLFFCNCLTTLLFCLDHKIYILLSVRIRLKFLSNLWSPLDKTLDLWFLMKIECVTSHPRFKMNLLWSGLQKQEILAITSILLLYQLVSSFSFPMSMCVRSLRILYEHFFLYLILTDEVVTTHDEL